MDLIIELSGHIRCIYGETIPIYTLGRLSISRASNVEPDSAGQWIADLKKVNGPKLGPFQSRIEALQAESDWLAKNWLLPSG